MTEIISPEEYERLHQELVAQNKLATDAAKRRGIKRNPRMVDFEDKKS